MNNKSKEMHIFNPAEDSENLALEIIDFLKKWGLYRDVCIFTNGKCYQVDTDGELLISEEINPEKYLIGPLDFEGMTIWKDYSNPERLLDMTFEGPFYYLLNYCVYNVETDEISEEVKGLIPEECVDFYGQISLTGKIPNHLFNEFNNLFEKYGLWFDIGFSWTLTAYRL